MAERKTRAAKASKYALIWYLRRLRPAAALGRTLSPAQPSRRSTRSEKTRGAQ